MSFVILNADVPLQIGNKILFEEFFRDALRRINFNSSSRITIFNLPPICMKTSIYTYFYFKDREKMRGAN